MNALTRYWEALKRSFAPGPGVVDPSLAFWGVDNTQFGPPEYGSYIATSNGVYACARLRAQLLASLPIRVYRVQKNGDKREVTTGDLWTLLQKVNPFWTMNRLIEMTELSLCLWGEAFWFLDRGASGGRPPREIWWARPDRVKVKPHPTEYISGFLYEPSHGGEPISFSPSEVIWLRFPNPLDEFSGLSPLAAARIAADSASAAMQSNVNIFRNGVQLAGLITPDATGSGRSNFSDDQARQLEEGLARRFKGVDKAHRWAVLRFDAKFQSMQMTPKDAEFLGALRWALEDIARAYGVPLDLVGGQRTYENVQAAQRAIWEHTVRPEARFIATEITEQLLPLFPGQADLCEFDLSEVEVLREAETERWRRTKEQIDTGYRTINQALQEDGQPPVPWGDVWWAPTAGGGVAPIVGPNAPLALNAAIAAGAITVNEWRKQNSLPAVPWGDVWWAPASIAPITDAAEPAPDETTDAALAASALLAAGEDIGEDVAEERGARRTRSIPYGSPEHERAYRAFVDGLAPHERAILTAVRTVLRRLRQSVLAAVNRGADVAAAVALDPFDRARWTKALRTEGRPLIQAAIEAGGTAGLNGLPISIAFDVLDPNVLRALERQTQRFAREVTQTTWDRLKASLGEGITAGEGVDALAERVRTVMGARLQDAELIARTETVTAYNAGTWESWRQSGVVRGKTWIAALDSRTRPTHTEAHGQTVPLEADFVVGAGRGPHPGAIGLASEDCNCRCSLRPVLDTEPLPERTIPQNGHRHVAALLEVLA